MGLRLNLMIKSTIFTYMFIVIPAFFHFSDARFPMQLLHFKDLKPPSKEWEKPKLSNLVNVDSLLKPANAELLYGSSSPSSLPPLESLSPISLPHSTTPPFCVNTPFSPSPLSPIGNAPTPPSPHFPPNLPIKSPPPSPPQFASPPTYIPTPKPPPFEPSPPECQPPVVYPPPTVPPPPHKKPQFAVWCVAKPTVPDTIIQEALDYACGSGADCKSIEPNGTCFQPNTLVAHASYAFNSYWQNTKLGGGTCDFGGTAMLVTVDPSYNDCYFVIN